jgi:hypothetical protein
MDCTLSNEDQRAEVERLGLDYESLYKRGLECAAAHNLTGTVAEDFAKDYVTGFIEGYTEATMPVNVEIAKKLLARNYDIRLTAEATGLTEYMLRNLQSVS